MDLRPTIVFALILFTSLSSVSATVYDFQYEEIWVQQGTFTIGTGEAAEIGAYTVL
jgi:alpha/beta superfamily hydrolase